MRRAAQTAAEQEDVPPADSDAASSRSNGETPAGYSEWAGTGTGGRDGGDYNLEAFVSAETTLADHLAEQLALAIADPARRMIGQYLIDLVDEAGYLGGDLGLVGEKLGAPLPTSRPCWRSCRASIRRACARAPSPNASPSSSRSAIASIPRWRRWSPISTCSPSAISGVAPNLRRERGGSHRHDRRDSPAQSEARSRLRVDPGAADRAGRVRAHRRPTAASWSSSIPTRCPRCWSTSSYHAQVAKTAKNEKDKSYLADCLQTATWLIRALDQRAKTILKVATEIVRQQDAFFAHGVQHLRPLNLKTIADAIAMHESTVSRVTANKYMATSRGIFELKYFFTSSIAAADGGEAHSAEAVRHRIRQLIDAEGPDARAVRRHHRGEAARGRHRHRPPNGRKISRGDANSVVGAAAAGEAIRTAAVAASRSSVDLQARGQMR